MERTIVNPVNTNTELAEFVNSNLTNIPFLKLCPVWAFPLTIMLEAEAGKLSAAPKYQFKGFENSDLAADMATLSNNLMILDHTPKPFVTASPQQLAKLTEHRNIPSNTIIELIRLGKTFLDDSPLYTYPYSLILDMHSKKGEFEWKNFRALEIEDILAFLTLFRERGNANINILLRSLRVSIRIGSNYISIAQIARTAPGHLISDNQEQDVQIGGYTLRRPRSEELPKQIKQDYFIHDLAIVEGIGMNVLYAGRTAIDTGNRPDFRGINK